MKKRVITAIVLLAILIPLIVIDSMVTEIIFAVVATFLCAVGSFEIMHTMTKESPELKKYQILVPILTGILGFLCLLATYKTSESRETIRENFVYHFYVLGFLLFSICLLFGLMIFTKNSQARAMMGCLLALVYPGLMLGYALSFRYFEPIALSSHLHDVSGIKFFIFLYLIVIATDTFAFFVGIKFGKTKLCPSISPNKSVAGAVGGLVSGMIVGVGGAYILGIVKPSGLEENLLTILVLAILSAFLSINVQLGDLVESKLKRSFEVKDFGNIFPGHGGVLDRFDSLIYAGTWLYLIIQIAQLIVIGA